MLQHRGPYGPAQAVCLQAPRWFMAHRSVAQRTKPSLLPVLVPRFSPDFCGNDCTYKKNVYIANVGYADTLPSSMQFNCLDTSFDQFPQKPNCKTHECSQNAVQSCHEYAVGTVSSNIQDAGEMARAETQASLSWGFDCKVRLGLNNAQRNTSDKHPSSPFHACCYSDECEREQKYYAALSSLVTRFCRGWHNNVSLPHNGTSVVISNITRQINPSTPNFPWPAVCHTLYLKYNQQ